MDNQRGTFSLLHKLSHYENCIRSRRPFRSWYHFGFGPNDFGFYHCRGFDIGFIHIRHDDQRRVDLGYDDQRYHFGLDGHGYHQRHLQWLDRYHLGQHGHHQRHDGYDLGHHGHRHHQRYV